MLRGVETRCSAVWSAHLFWVQRAIGSNPVTLMSDRSQPKEEVKSFSANSKKKEMKDEIGKRLSEFILSYQNAEKRNLENMP